MIQIQGVRKRFGDQVALAAVDLHVGAGERVAFVGPNGSGKTTLLRCLLGLHNFDGKITVAGLDVRTARREALARIGFVPQAPPALRFTVAEYLSFAEAATGVDARSVTALATRLGLDLATCQRRAFRKLSGGMKQKLLIAVALARRPALLIMDEPTANLDPAARTAFFELLAELPRETVILLSSHRVDELAGLVSRLVELDGGLVVKDEAVTAGGGAQLAGKVRCHVVLSETLAPVVRGLADWGLETRDQGRSWTGQIGAPDRFRLLAELARWSAVIDRLEVRSEADAEAATSGGDTHETS